MNIKRYIRIRIFQQRLQNMFTLLRRIAASLENVLTLKISLHNSSHYKNIIFDITKELENNLYCSVKIAETPYGQAIRISMGLKSGDLLFYLDNIQQHDGALL